MYTPYTNTKKSLDTESLFTAPWQKKKTQLTLTGHTKPTSGHRRDDRMVIDGGERALGQPVLVSLSFRHFPRRTCTGIARKF